MSVFSFKKANFELKIEYFAQITPTFPDFLVFGQKNPGVFGKFFLEFEFFPP